MKRLLDLSIAGVALLLIGMPLLFLILLVRCKLRNPVFSGKRDQVCAVGPSRWLSSAR